MAESKLGTTRDANDGGPEGAAEDEKFHLVLSGSGLELDMVIDSAKAGRIASIAIQSSTRDVEALRTDVPPAPTSPRDYAAHLSHGTIPEKICAFGSFLKVNRGTTSFGRGELMEVFQEAGEPIPRNLPRDLAKTVRLGWIAPRPGERGKYYVTNAGFAAISGRES
jgi:hypothetical protein